MNNNNNNKNNIKSHYFSDHILLRDIIKPNISAAASFFLLNAK